MDDTKFKALHDQSRNGCNGFYRHPLVRWFHYSDGVQELAELGCYWLLDILATEAPKAMRKKGETLLSITVLVDKTKTPACQIIGTGSGDSRVWRRDIQHTDLPDGEWKFELGDEGTRFALILQTEH